MEELQELVRIVTKNKAKRIDIIGNPANYTSNLQRLYEGVVSGQFESELAAMEYFYPNDGNQKPKFNRLKKRLSERLINTLFFIDVNLPNFTEQQRAYYSSYKDFAALKVLIGRSAKKSVIPFAEKLLRKAIQFEFTDLAVNVLQELRMQFGTIEGNHKKHKECNALLHEYYDILKAELLAEEYYIELAVNFVNSRASKTELEETAQEYMEELEPYAKKFKTQRFIMLAYTVFALRYQISNDYHNTLRVCQEAISMFEKRKKMASKTFMFTFLYKMASCFIQLGEYEKGEKTILRCMSLMDKGGYNWYITCDYYMILLFRSGQYQKALRVFLDAVNHPGYKNMPPAYFDVWAVHESYIHYLIAIGEIKPGLKDEDDLGKFRLAKFLNDVPVYSKDKRGTNISILILQVLFLVKQKRYEEAQDRLNALKAYSHRYLRKDDTFRSNCFIHMLLQLPNSYFNRKAAIRKAKKYLDKLKEVPLEVANQTAELEPVPYERLWEFVLASLKG